MRTKKCKGIYLKEYQKRTNYSKVWRENNKEKHKADNKRYRQENSDKIKKYREKYNQEHKEKIYLYFQKYRQEHKEEISRKRKTITRRFSSYKSMAKYNNRDFYLTFEEFKELIESGCYYCGSKKRIGIDRKDNSIGYIKDNCVSCCWPCNYIKGVANDKNFISVCLAVSKHLNKSRASKENAYENL